MSRRTEIADHVLAGVAVAAVALAVTTPNAWSQNQEPASQSTGSDFVTMQDDLADRSHGIHWPKGFDPAKADLFAHNRLVINAPCDRVWAHIVDATKWPEWYPNSKDVRFVGDGAVLKQHSVFRWTTFGLALESRIEEFEPNSRIGWFGYAPGTAPAFYHTWYLTPKGDACDVVMEEVGMGPDAARLRRTDEGGMHRGHDLWLATLKWVAEKIH